MWATIATATLRLKISDAGTVKKKAVYLALAYPPTRSSAYGTAGE
ncbi:hypothetical protein [Massilia niabensis]|uniref:Uncharacterized protein n=1 Tax=Massilia niabensis TaxID=544910 RepID=A0ABW0KY39_9BURK